MLLAKYGIKDGIPLSIAHNNHSFLWRALAKVWPLLRENIFWSVGDDNFTTPLSVGGTVGFRRSAY